ncbi:EEF1A lysine methyltransferase 1 [Leptinotarsa decemlineata]|uniref:EEF1A lysine methyltransferase 1 n=1 Tax=Leptinotarsa decemlineata TaxID=7539 RepID=UPI003D30698B
MSSNVSDDEDVPQLSAETFAVLQEFYKEQEERESNLVLDTDPNASLEEDWQLSQFWYDDHTIDVLVDVALKSVGDNGKIALVSCPTLYKKMRRKARENCEITLFEYDKRFSVYGKDFIFYDYKSPLDVPRDKSDYYDLVIADPPFLSDECLTKTAVTIRFLTKDKIILCTGAVMADMAKRLLDLQKSSFEPRHKNNLANEFWCYSNFNLNELL